MTENITDIQVLLIILITVLTALVAFAIVLVAKARKDIKKALKKLLKSQVEYEYEYVDLYDINLSLRMRQAEKIVKKMRDEIDCVNLSLSRMMKPPCDKVIVLFDEIEEYIEETRPFVTEDAKKATWFLWLLVAFCENAPSPQPDVTITRNWEALRTKADELENLITRIIIEEEVIYEPSSEHLKEHLQLLGILEKEEPKPEEKI